MWWARSWRGEAGCGSGASIAQDNRAQRAAPRRITSPRETSRVAMVANLVESVSGNVAGDDALGQSLVQTGMRVYLPRRTQRVILWVRAAEPSAQIQNIQPPRSPRSLRLTLWSLAPPMPEREVRGA